MRWLVLTLLFAATTINYLDRGILGVILPEIRKQLTISTQAYGRRRGATASRSSSPIRSGGSISSVAWWAVHRLMGNLEPITLQPVAV